MMHEKNFICKLCCQMVLILILFTVFFPFIYMICGSFMNDAEINRYLFCEGWKGLHLIPQYFVIKQYKKILVDSPEFLAYFWNSMNLILPILAGVFVIAPLAGNGLARYKIPGRRLILGLYILLAILPYQAMLVPNYIVLEKLRLLGKIQAVWYICIWNPFGVYLMYRFFCSIDIQTLEAARLDGAGEWKIYTRISMPQVIPGLATLLLLSIADICGMVEQPMIFLKDATMYPLSVAFSSIADENIGMAYAGAVIYLIPILIVFLFTKKYLVAGVEVTAGAMKG